MIEINLVPDVKQELIRAKRVQTVVITGAVFVGIAAIAIVILLALYLFGVQTVRSNLADSAINDKSKQLSNVSDLANTLTIQNQLTKLTELHNGKNIDSRFFDLLVAVNPEAPNNVTFSTTRIDADTKTIRLEGQAANGYTAADVLKKTILGTTISYKDSTGTKSVALTKGVSTSDLSYGEDSSGKKVLRFTLSFVYDDTFFARSSEAATILRPDRQNATDSFLHLPESLFSDRATADSTGGN
ncbi:MAG: putative Fimbrial assembly family protein [Candidatus Saccharibacteria bacterium]|nr:putative Fimbrial assembly family protein [Candidatus Saccharibacteria bacterium]